MRDSMPEQQIHPLGLSASEDRDYDYDYDYDLYYFYPSISPYIVSPHDLEVFDQLESAIDNRWTIPDDNHSPRSISPVVSLSYTTTSEFAFPEVQVEDGLAGYSRFFISGFQYASQRLSRRLDNTLRILQDGLRKTKRRLRL